MLHILGVFDSLHLVADSQAPTQGGTQRFVKSCEVSGSEIFQVLSVFFDPWENLELAEAFFDM